MSIFAIKASCLFLQNNTVSHFTHTHNFMLSIKATVDTTFVNIYDNTKHIDRRTMEKFFFRSVFWTAFSNLS